ncbi:GDP-mannose 4,6-dehydratase, partial [Rhizobium leguminosarum]|uniref:GDP-mannose 4,6-dehydratase n=1 Tax=Rhizobium leguminosarum TaxID=384 RepID=UPI003F9CF80F
HLPDVLSYPFSSTPFPRQSIGKCVVEIDPAYFRPTEVDLLIGDPTKAHTKLGWKHETNLDQLVAEMVREDLKIMARN